MVLRYSMFLIQVPETNRSLSAAASNRGKALREERGVSERGLKKDQHKSDSIFNFTQDTPHILRFNEAQDLKFLRLPL